MLTKEQAYPLPFDGRYQGSKARFALLAPFAYRNGNDTVDVPVGYITDGASIPPFVYSIIGGPWSGNYIEPAIVHDWNCHLAKTVEDRKVADARFLVGMKILKVALWRRRIMWRAVRAQAYILYKLGRLT